MVGGSGGSCEDGVRRRGSVAPLPGAPGGGGGGPVSGQPCARSSSTQSPERDDRAYHSAFRPSWSSARTSAPY